MAEYTVTITARQNFILISTLTQYNNAHQHDEGFIPLTVQEFLNTLLELELNNKEREVQQQYKSLIDVLQNVSSETRTIILDTLPIRIKNYLMNL